jgi:hypothetical protein
LAYGWAVWPDGTISAGSEEVAGAAPAVNARINSTAYRKISGLAQTIAGKMKMESRGAKRAYRSLIPILEIGRKADHYSRTMVAIDSSKNGLLRGAQQRRQ